MGPALRRARWTDAFGIADPARQEFERPDFAMGGGIVEVVALPLLHCALGEENLDAVGRGLTRLHSKTDVCDI